MNTLRRPFVTSFLHYPRTAHVMVAAHSTVPNGYITACNDIFSHYNYYPDKINFTLGFGVFYRNRMCMVCRRGGRG